VIVIYVRSQLAKMLFFAAMSTWRHTLHTMAPRETIRLNCSFVRSGYVLLLLNALFLIKLNAIYTTVCWQGLFEDQWAVRTRER
jgi:hypothetical protein